MNALQIILVILITLAGYPIGLLLANYTKEELKSGRKWFKLLMLFSIVMVIISFIFFSRNNLFFLLAVFIFIFLLTLASFIKSKRKI
jgi:hypothetical protein